MVNTKNNYTILATVDITQYTSLRDLYEYILSLKKDVYANEERIVFIYRTDNQRRLLDELLLVIDIPDYFTIFETTDNASGLDFSFPNHFCIYPWINLRISTIGEISPCCMFDGSIPDANITQGTLKDAYQSTFMRNLRQEFLDNKQTVACSKCWKEESIGKDSMRQRAKYKFRDIYYRLDYQQENFNNLQLFDLNLGNTCNLGCKICNRDSSSTIAEQDHVQGIISVDELTELKQRVRWADTEEFWEQILDSAQNLKYLDLYGGEPLMSKLHFNFLKKLIELDIAKNIKIDYNTNGTIYSEKFFDLWQHFKEIKLSFSIDDIQDRFEAQRVGARWHSVCENIEKYNSWRSVRFITEVYPTINTQNVYWLPELLDWISTQSFDHTAFNILHNPAHYNISSLNSKDKLMTIEKLKNYPHDICKSVVQLLDVAKTHRQIEINKV